jgi:hypothetical protein
MKRFARGNFVFALATTVAASGCAGSLGGSAAVASPTVRASAVARVVIDRGGASAPVTVEARAEAAAWAAGQALSESVARVVLAPEGRWESTSLGELWFPDVAHRETFEPFVTHGQWGDEPSGPRWRSEFVWGAVAFHYGQWLRIGERWAWRFGTDYSPAPVRWRVSGRHVGWSVADVDHWCWLSFDGLFAPSPATRGIRGRAAAPLAATSVEHGHSIGWATDLRGRAPSGNPTTTGAVRSTGDDALEPRAADRWATVVIRDDSALDRFEELSTFESPPSTSVTRVDAAVGATPTAPIAGRAQPSANPVRSATRSGLWSDQERLRAPLVANIAPRFEPWARSMIVRVEPSAPAPQVAPQSAPLPAQPPTTPSSSSSVGFVGASSGPRFAPVVTATPSVPAAMTAVPVRITPTLAGGALRTVR